MFKNQNVGVRLGLAFGSVVLLLLLTYYVGVTRLSSINALMTDINATNIPETQLANAMLRALASERVEIRNIILMTDGTQLAKQKAKFDAERQEFDAAESALDKMFGESTTTTDTEKQLAAKIHTSKAEFIAKQDKVIALGMVNKNDEATAILFGDAYNQTVGDLENALSDLASFEDKMNHDDGESGVALYQSAFKILTGAVVSAVLLAIAAAFFVTRSIRNPLLKVVTHFQEIRQGRYNGKIDVNSGGEIGQVLGALKATQQALLDASIKAADDAGRIVAISKAQAVIEFELDGTIRAANENFLNAVGYRLDDVKGKNHSMLVAADYRQSGEYKQFWDALRRGQNQVGMFKRLGSNGREVWLQASYNPLIDLDGKVYRVVKYATDVTEQVRLKQGLDDATLEQTRVRQALDSAVADTQAIVKSAIDGNLMSRIPMDGKTGEIAALCQGINTLLEATMTLITSIKTAAQEVQSGAVEISRGNTDLSQRTEQQAASLEQTASSMEQMTSSVRQTADNAGQANQLATAARQQAENGGAIVASAVTAMSQINSSSKKIADIIGVIDEIAFQTNLLALNAAVEAARAGEQGRGFAVVASEVRNLAGRSATAAKEIKSLIQDSVAKVEEGSKLVDESGKALEDIVASVKKVNDIVSEIAAASREQSAGIEQVGKAVAQMDEVTQQNAALVEEAAAASQSIVDQAQGLNDVVARYQVGESGRAAAQIVAPAKPTGSVAPERRKAKRPWAKAANSPAAAPKVAAAGGASGDAEWSQF
jgi:methyl-accepting chemotaxis protein